MNFRKSVTDNARSDVACSAECHGERRGWLEVACSVCQTSRVREVIVDVETKAMPLLAGGCALAMRAAGRSERRTWIR
jgi:hypothetical protein